MTSDDLQSEHQKHNQGSRIFSEFPLISSDQIWSNKVSDRLIIKRERENIKHKTMIQMKRKIKGSGSHTQRTDPTHPIIILVYAVLLQKL